MDLAHSTGLKHFRGENERGRGQLGFGDFCLVSVAERNSKREMMNRFWYLGFFVVSGFCSLVYETVWLRLAMAKFGVTTPMVSIVLSIFMAGLALGSWAGGAVARRLENSDAKAPLRFYGLIEIIIGVSGLVVPLLINFGYGMLMNTRNSFVWDSSRYYLASGLWITASLLPWCTCMGATFPMAMCAIRKTSATGTQQSFSYLYLSNVLGAILGTLVPAYFLIEMLGFRGTMRVATALNVLLAATVFALSFGKLGSSAAAEESPQEKFVPERLYNLPASSVFWFLFITGVCSMAIEVVWIRLFTPYLGNVVYSFATILALYLGATYAGSLVYRYWVRSHGLEGSRVAWILLGPLALLALSFADRAVPIALYGGWLALRVGLGVVPFSMALGFLTPLLVDHFSGGDPDRAGRAYAVNVLGSIAGPLLAGFWILPWLGEHWGLVALAIPLFGIGLVTVLSAKSSEATGRGVLRNRVLYAGAVLASVPLAVLTEGYETRFEHRVELRDYTATVIATGEGMNKLLLVNGVGMTVLTPITKYMTHLPLAFLDRPPKKTLVICFGMGTTFRSMLSWGVDSTVVDLVPSVPKLFGYYHPDGPRLLESPMAHVVADDGRRFLERSNEQYDVITLDPPPPISAPTTSLLFSREFYTILRRHLRPGGIVQMWVYTADTRWDRAFPVAAVKAIQESFPYTRAFLSLDGWGLHILASNDPIPLKDAKTLAGRLPEKAAKDFVEWGPAATPEGMFAIVLGQEVPLKTVSDLDARVPAIQDDQPINEYYFLRRNFGYYR